MQKLTIVVRGMHEEADEARVKEALHDIKGLEKIVTDHPAKRVTLFAPDDVNPDVVKEAISKAGYDVGEISMRPAKKGLFGVLK